jgi:hypothetical protein
MDDVLGNHEIPDEKGQRGDSPTFLIIFDRIQNLSFDGIIILKLCFPHVLQIQCRMSRYGSDTVQQKRDKIEKMSAPTAKHFWMLCDLPAVLIFEGLVGIFGGRGQDSD